MFHLSRLRNTHSLHQILRREDGDCRVATRPSDMDRYRSRKDLWVVQFIFQLMDIYICYMKTYLYCCLNTFFLQKRPFVRGRLEKQTIQIGLCCCWQFECRHQKSFLYSIKKYSLKDIAMLIIYATFKCTRFNVIYAIAIEVNPSFFDVIGKMK